MINNKIILENKVVKNMPEANIIQNMESLGFENISDAKKHNKYSITSRLYLFIKKDTCLCQIETYEGKASSITLMANYKNNNSNDFSKPFSSTTWTSSTGSPSGYGYTLKVGNLTVNGDLKETLEEMKIKGHFVFPFIERYFHIDESIFSKEEKEKYSVLNDIEGRTQWFIDNKINASSRKFFGPEKTQDHEDKRDVMNYWDDYIRWNYKSQSKDKIDRKDKNFYTICKDIILKDIEEIKPLIDKNFIYQTTSLGQNFCHLMSIIQDPAKKELLWNHFKTLGSSHQANFITQNDCNGYNPLLILVQHQGIRPVRDTQMNLEYFNKYLGVKGVETAFYNDKNSLLDCLLYSNSIDAGKTIDYLSKITEHGLEIPMVYLKKERPFSSEQKVIDKFEGEEVKKHLNPYVCSFINTIDLNKKISNDLPIKEADNTRLNKI